MEKMRMVSMSFQRTLAAIKRIGMTKIAKRDATSLTRSSMLTIWRPFSTITSTFSRISMEKSMRRATLTLIAKSGTLSVESSRPASVATKMSSQLACSK